MASCAAAPVAATTSCCAGSPRTAAAAAYRRRPDIVACFSDEDDKILEPDAALLAASGEMAELARPGGEWVVPPAGRLSPLQAAHLRLALSALLSARLTQSSWTWMVRDVDVVGMVAAQLATGVRLVFSRAARELTLSERGSLVLHPGSFVRCAAVAAQPSAVMHTGERHYVEYHIERYQAGRMVLGVAKGAFDPRVGGWATASDQGWGFSARTGSLSHQGKRLAWASGRQEILAEGDVLGLMLDLQAGSLTAFKNGVNLGVMVSSGLTGPLCWIAELAHGGDSVRILPVAVSAVERHNALMPERMSRLRAERRRRQEEHARQQLLGKADREMRVGTRVYIEAVRFNSTAPTKRAALKTASAMALHGAGTYAGWTRNFVGRNDHWVRFDAEDEVDSLAADGQLLDLDQDKGWGSSFPEGVPQLMSTGGRGSSSGAEHDAAAAAAAKPAGRSSSTRREKKLARLKLCEMRWRVI